MDSVWVARTPSSTRSTPTQTPRVSPSRSPSTAAAAADPRPPIASSSTSAPNPALAAAAAAPAPRVRRPRSPAQQQQQQQPQQPHLASAHGGRPAALRGARASALAAGTGAESYLASASGSQTDGADGETESTTSGESDGDEAVLRARIFGEGFGAGDAVAAVGGHEAAGWARSGRVGAAGGRGGSTARAAGAAAPLYDVRRLGAPSPQWAGERGRGEHVLVKKRSTSPGSSRGGDYGAGGGGGAGGDGGGGGGSSAHRERSWGSALLDTLEGHHSHSQGSKERRRPVSLTLSALRGGRGSSARNRPTKVLPSEQPPAVREPSPPLTFDSIRPGWSNPFALYHIRTSLVFEVVILVVALAFAVYRLYSMQPTAVFPSIPAVPLGALVVFTVAVPFIALFRREGHYFKAPFTDERGYRDSKQADDGVAAALVLPVLLAVAVWWDTYATADATGRGVGLEGIRSLVDVWEHNGIHAASSPRLALADGRGRGGFDPSVLSAPLERARALFQARYELVLLTALNAACLLLHLALARTLFRIERLPKSNTKRFFGFMAVATTLSAAVWAAFALCDYLVDGGLPIHPLEAAVTTHIQQSSFYLVSRLARRGFTLGELNTMTVAGNALCLEFWRLSWARWNYKRGFPYIPPTFRAPTPVIAFQSVLIPGAFMSGFLLSPLLVVSRHIASRPSHRLKWPTERERHRKLLALGVAVGLAAIVCVPLGGWAGWMLGASPPSFARRLRRPWGWALRFFAFGDSDGVADWQQPAALHPPGWSLFSAKRTSRGWRRIALVAYWGTTISSAIGGWQTHLVRKRRIRTRASPAQHHHHHHKPPPEHSPTTSSFALSGAAGGPGGAAGEGSTAAAAAAQGEGAVRSTGSAAAAAAGKRLLGFGMDAMHGAARMSAAAGASAGVSMRRSPVGRIGAESAREEKAVHASLNMRRKFFHALAVLMFVPGIAVDPAFTSLAFSVAFSLFTFAEYARYFALYPIGGPLHIFFSEFVDSKDGGPVILSHFYLLTGCAGGLWLEGRGINRYTGVLVLGVGDSLASIVGKLVGRTRWLGTTKTLEGTAAFISSVVLCGWLLRLIGVVEPFSLPRYILGVTLAALLEAASAQNDNLVIPLYLWSVLSLLSV